MAIKIKAETVVIVVGAVWAVILYSAIGYAIYSYWHSIYEFFAYIASSSTGRTIVLPIFGVVAACILYILRSLARIQYGATEVMFGVLSLISLSNAVPTASIQTTLLQTAAGIYIIIRGLDNIQKGVEESSDKSLKSSWNKVFGNEGQQTFIKFFQPNKKIENIISDDNPKT